VATLRVLFPAAWHDVRVVAERILPRLRRRRVDAREPQPAAMHDAGRQA
jgi:hypothetical protein